MPTLPPRPQLRSSGLRFRFRRRPLPYWLVAAAVSLATAALIGHLVAGAAAERSHWGRLQATLVTTAEVRSGSRLSAADTEVRLLPAVAVPAGALRSLPAGAVVAADLHRGEAVLTSRLVGARTSVVAARLPAGTRGVAVPAGTGLPLEVGDHVDVLATFDPGDTATASGSGEGGDEPTFAVARHALIVDVGEDAVTVAVAETAAPRVAYALAAGTVTLVLSGTS